MTRILRQREAVSETVAAVAAEVRALRQRQGVSAANLHQRLGPHLRELVGPAGDMDPRGWRAVLASELEARAEQLAPPFRLAILAGLGLSAETRHMSHFGDRIAWLAGAIGREDRSALRRINAAEVLLAEQICAELGRRRSGLTADWYVDELDVLLRLDVCTPEAQEHRHIVATRNGVREVTVAHDLPTATPQDRPELESEVLYGGRLLRRQQPTRTRFDLVVELPRVLTAGESHRFGLLVRIPKDQDMQPHYVLTPEVACRLFSLRARFAPDHRPIWIRRVDGETVRTFEAAQADRGALELDDAGEAWVQFHGPARHLGYGLQWRW